MKKEESIIKLFTKFIKETETGKRLKKNGEKIKPQTVDNYRYVLQNLILFQETTHFKLRICDSKKLTTREYTSEKNYWKKFYKKFTEFLYKKGCHDNYVGTNIKIIRTFFNYLKNDKDFNTGDFQRMFYVRNENIEILVLSTEQLKFLIHNKNFEESLSKSLKRIKDIFVFGCATGLRFSDIFLLTNKNFVMKNEVWYLKVKSKKSKVYSYIKLPTYAIDIYKKHKKKSNKVLLFKKISLFNFNKHLKNLGQRANFDHSIELTREKLGKPRNIKRNGEEVLFYQKMSSHMMRRTAITTHLMLGMPEHLVRNISGHSGNSKSFNRYVHYAQSYIDKEIDKVHEKLETA